MARFPAQMVAVLTVGLLSCSTAGAVGLPGTGGTIVPGPQAAAVNPAYLQATVPTTRGGTSSGMTYYLLPVGLLGMLRKGANPFQYLTNRAAFSKDFDLATMITVLSIPDQFLFNPPTGVDQLSVGVSASGVTINTGPQTLLTFPPTGTSTYSFRSSSGSYVLFGTFLPPPDSYSLSYRAGPLVLSSGLFVGGARSLDIGKDVLGITGRTLAASASAQIGIDQAITLPLPLVRRRNLDLSGALRLVGFYSSAFAQMGAAVDTALVTSVTNPLSHVAAQVVYGYPGSGYGLGARIDAGSVLRWKQLEVGLGVLGIFGASKYAGKLVAVGVQSAGPVWSETKVGTLPAGIAEAKWRFVPSPKVSLSPVASGLLQYTGSGVRWGANGGLLVQVGKLELRGGGGWDGSWNAGIGVRWEKGRWGFETGLTVEQQLLSKVPLGGMYLAIGR